DTAVENAPEEAEHTPVVKTKIKVRVKSVRQIKQAAQSSAETLKAKTLREPSDLDTDSTG
ncbi:MAG: hypothetical protein ACRC1W_15315, partial [Shewanella sp.]